MTSELKEACIRCHGPVEQLIETWGAVEEDRQKIYKGKTSLEQNKRLWERTRLTWKS